MNAFRPMLLAAACLLLAGLGGPASAQGRQGAQSSAEPSNSAASTVQVGAGTTNGTTTGYSGPSEPGGDSPGVPPPPQPSLCDAYDGDVHQQCMQTVLGAAVGPN